MLHATLLYVATMSTPDTALKEAAEGARTKDIHLAILLFASAPTLPPNAYGALPYGGIGVPDHWPTRLKEAQSAVKTRRREIDQILAKAGASGDVRPVLTTVGDLATYVARSAKSSDMALLAPDLRDQMDVFKAVVHGVLFQSPIGVLLNAATASEFETIFLAWDDSPAAARAAHVALPLLRNARKIRIGCFDPSTIDDGAAAEPGADVAAWLSHHGCDVTVSHDPSGGREIGAAILERAAEDGADLIVMGAYGHSRMRQAVFGGTTRTLLDEAERPVFLAH